MSLDVGLPAGLLAALAAICLAACGGGDPEPVQTTAPAVTGATQPDEEDKAPGTTSPEDEPAPDPATDRAAIAATLRAVLASDGEDPCGRLVTERYLRRSYGDAAGCEAAQRGAKPARGVRVGRVVILPDSLAQASARPTGGIYDDERLRAELVLDEGVWKLDSLRSNVPVGP